MTHPESSRIRSFLVAFDRRRAGRVTEVPGGFAVFDDEFPASHGDNHLVLPGAVEDPEALPAFAEKVLGGLRHRTLYLYDDEAGAACVAPMVRAGYEHSVDLTMLHTGPLPGGDLARRAEVVGLDDLRGPLTDSLRGFLPDVGDEDIHQLVERRESRRRGADTVHFLASRTETGEVASWADLYLDPAEGIAQIEELATAEAHLRRGHADAVVATALRMAAEAGCDTRFLIADEADWPRHWYVRRGFDVIGRWHCFERDD
ncbi:GNAT family N-acetyltransferase [Streptomyces sp. NPDC051561]|uniref:GNAT family N-acetyltransferase n=1 Tax=Streptomyces sp. NPDC051561 TaxID=3365658 RepID=UPI0037994A2D